MTMSQERDLHRTHTTRITPAQDDDDIAPGRGSRSSRLTAPEHPLESGLLQRKASGDRGSGDADAVHRAAAHGTSGSSTSLPHLDQIQRSFGPSHDVSGVSAHIGGAAAEACDAIGASAYASGNAVAFRSPPDLHTAAHEAAHVVQQRQGISLYGGIGEAGDVHERHADAVADRVVAGQPAADLLAGHASGGAAILGVQRKQGGEAAAEGDTAIVQDGDLVGASAGAGAGAVQRTEKAETSDAKQTAVPAGRSSASPEVVTMDWNVDYQNVAGQTKGKLPDRYGDDQLIVKELKIDPDGKEKPRKLKGGNMAESGNVYLGQVTVPKGSGQVTAAVQYAQKKDFDVALEVAPLPSGKEGKKLLDAKAKEAREAVMA
jgi:hypothetical protein